MKITNVNEFMKMANKNGLKENEDNIIINNYDFLNKEVKTLKDNNIPYTIFTLIHEDGEWLISQGLYKINRIGHIVIKEKITIPVEGFIY